MATSYRGSEHQISGGGFLIEERRPDEVFTPEDFSEQHQLIGKRRICRQRNRAQYRKNGAQGFPSNRELLKKAGDLGLSGVEVPEQYGGMEMDKVTAAIIADPSPSTPASALHGKHIPVSAPCPSCTSARKTEREILAWTRARGNSRSLCAFRIVFRVRRAQLPGSSPAFRRRQTFIR